MPEVTGDGLQLDRRDLLRLGRKAVVVGGALWVGDRAGAKGEQSRELNDTNALAEILAILVKERRPDGSIGSEAVTKIGQIADAALNRDVPAPTEPPGTKVGNPTATPSKTPEQKK